MNERTIQARAAGARDGSARRRQGAPADVTPATAISRIAGRTEAVRRNLAATLKVTDAVPDLVEVSGEFRKTR